MKYFLGVFLGTILSITYVTTNRIGIEGRLIHDLVDEGYDPRERPLRSVHDVVTFDVDFCLQAFFGLDMDSHTASGIIQVNLQWYDFRLAWDINDYDGLNMLFLDNNLVWMPRLMLHNPARQNIYDIFDSPLARPMINSDGMVKVSVPVRFETPCPLKTENYPFDNQTCHLVFKPPIAPIRTFHVGQVTVTECSVITNADWEVTGVSAMMDLIRDQRTTNLYAQLNIEMSMRSISRFEITNIVVSSSVISVIALLVFLIPVESGEKLTTSAILFLSVIVFQIFTVDVLPINSSSNMPPVVRFTYMNFAVACGAITSTIISLVLRGRNTRIKSAFWRRFWFDYVARIACLSQEAKERATLEVDDEEGAKINWLEMTKDSGSAEEEDENDDENSHPAISIQSEDGDKIQALTDMEFISKSINRIVFSKFIASQLAFWGYWMIETK